MSDSRAGYPDVARHEPWADPVIGVGPPSGNAREPRAFSSAALKTIEFPADALPTGWPPSKCARSSRVCKAVTAGNARGPRAISSDSFEKNQRLESGLPRCCPPPTGGRSRACHRAPVRKCVEPPRISGRFPWADRVPTARIAHGLAAIQMRAYLARLQARHRWKRARPLRNFERFIWRKPAP